MHTVKDQEMIKANHNQKGKALAKVMQVKVKVRAIEMRTRTMIKRSIRRRSQWMK